MPIDRNEKARLIFKAEALERSTKPKGRPSGCLGLTGIAVLRALLFAFGDRPEPSYKAIQRMTRFCSQAVSDALKRLEAAGLVNIERRTVLTALGVRKITNRYSFAQLGLSLILPSREQKEPSEKRKSAGIEQASAIAALALVREAWAGRFG